MNETEYQKLTQKLERQQEELQERLKELETEKRMLDALCVDYTSVHYCNLLEDTIVTIKSEAYASVRKNLESANREDELQSYTYRIQYYFDHYIVQESAEDFVEAFSIENLMKELQTKQRFIYQCRAKKNRTGQQHFEIQVARMPSQEGFEVIMGYRYIDDLVETQERQKKQLEFALEEAERANAAKTDFLRRMSHDLRTPLNGIRGMLQLSEHFAQDTEKLRECRQKMWESSEYLLNLVNSVLDMNKLESGKLVLQDKPFGIQEILNNLENVLGTQASAKGIVMKLQTNDLVHDRLIGSPMYVQQIFMNIGSNAVHYTPAGGRITITCTEEAVDAEISKYRFVVEDTGIGMSEEFQKHIYDVFTQEETGFAGSNTGTGLGMAICRQLVELMGGTIHFTSTKGVGTTFVVEIPIRLDSTAQGKDSEKTIMFQFQKQKILLAEDNELNCEIVKFMLEEAGAVVETAADGQEAVERFRKAEEGEYALILMDIMMPIMDGYEAAKTIRALPRKDAKKIPILALSANAFQDDVRECKEAGMNKHLEKPVSEEKLLCTISEYLLRK